MEEKTKSNPIRIFISYSQKDSSIKDKIKSYLSALSQNYNIYFFDDGDIKVGEKWDDRIQDELENSNIIVMLISPDYLASDYVRNIEIKKVQDKGEKYVVPVILRDVLWKDIDWLSSYQIFPRNGLPLSRFSNEEAILLDFSKEVEKIVNFIEISNYEPQKNTKKATTQADGNKPIVFISHSHSDGDFAEVLKMKLEDEGFDAWIDIDRLKVGQVWREEIDQGIKDAIAVIAVMSPDAKTSEYVTYEWSFAWGADKKILPIKVKETPFHPRLESLQYLDFTKREARPWQRLIDELKDIAKRK